MVAHPYSERLFHSMVEVSVIMKRLILALAATCLPGASAEADAGQEIGRTNSNAVSKAQKISFELTLPGPFVGNGGKPAFFGIDTQLTAIQSTVGNIGHSIVLNNARGPIGINNYGVGLFVAGNAQPGATDTWGANFASYVNRGVSASTNQFALELDQNISNSNYGASTFAYTGASGVFEAAPLKIVGATGAGLFKGTAAILATAAGEAWYRGIAFSGDSITTATFQDSTNSGTVMLVSGAHSYGVDMSRASGMIYALTTPPAVPIGLGKPGGGYVKIGVDKYSALHLGAGSTAIVTDTPLYPSTLVTPVVTPASSRAVCTPGQTSADSKYIYVCTAPNTWKRAALEAF